MGTEIERKPCKVRYALHNKDGIFCAYFATATAAASWAKRRWPDQQRDEIHSGDGWTIEVCE